MAASKPFMDFPDRLYIIKEPSNGGRSYFYAFETLTDVRELGFERNAEVGIYELRKVQRVKS